MLLAIDVGNTRIKGAVFEHNTLVKGFVFSVSELGANLSDILKVYPDCADLIVASVGNIAPETFLELGTSINVYFVTHHDSFPLQNLYETPLTLGIDRLVLASGAVLRFPRQHRLVIDAGTCITYDFIDAEDNYLGGAISPGLRLRYESLHHYTAQLPLLTTEVPQHFIGNSTSQSIHAGVVHGLANEIDGFITQYQQQYSNFIIILTGGDSDFLANRLKNTIFANSNFLLESLNQLFNLKIKND